MVEKKQLLPLLSNRGWVRVTPGEAYTLSASVKADPTGTPALLRVYVAFRGWEDKAVTATGEWQRVSFTFRPSGDQIYVGVGPDLRESKLPRHDAVDRRRAVGEGREGDGLRSLARPSRSGWNGRTRATSSSRRARRRPS